jgi:hypothetical protein
LKLQQPPPRVGYREYIEIAQIILCGVRNVSDENTFVGPTNCHWCILALNPALTNTLPVFVASPLSIYNGKLGPGEPNHTAF